MGYTRRGRFVALSAVGLLISGAVGVATAQNGINISTGSALATAKLEGLRANSAEIIPAHGPFGDNQSPSAMVRLGDATIANACVLLSTIDVPIIGEVTLVGHLAGEGGLKAQNLVIDATDISGALTLEGAQIGTGLTSPDERTNSGGIAVVGNVLDSPTLEVNVLGLTADKLTTGGIRLEAQRGTGSC